MMHRRHALAGVVLAVAVTTGCGSDDKPPGTTDQAGARGDAGRRAAPTPAPKPAAERAADDGVFTIGPEVGAEAPTELPPGSIAGRVVEGRTSGAGEITVTMNRGKNDGVELRWHAHLVTSGDFQEVPDSDFPIFKITADRAVGKLKVAREILEAHPNVVLGPYTEPEVDPGPPPTEVDGRVVNVSSTSDGATVVVVNAGRREGVALGWTAQLLHGADALDGGSFVISRVSSREARGRVSLPLEVVLENPRVRLTAPPD